MTQQTNEYRDKIAESFVKLLQEEKLDWKKGWVGLSAAPQNAFTNKKYKGINRFYLSILQITLGYTDSRWATYKQIQDKGWKLKRGSKGAKVEYWAPYDYEKKKLISWREYYDRLGNKGTKEPMGVISKYFHVFNAKDIEGIPELDISKNKEVVSDELIDKIIKGMKVSINNDGGNRAFYSILDDTIHLPLKEYFKTSYDYNSTALHELTHASGAENRLNRNMNNSFGTAGYAYEELVAEIGSSFMGEYLQVDVTEEHIRNHAAYLQNWITVISEKPNILFQAIKDAESAANYMEYQAELITEQDYTQLQNSCVEIPDSQVNIEPVTNYYSEKNIINDLKLNHFKPTKQLIENIQKVNQLTGKNNSIKDICKFHKEMADLPNELKTSVENIAKECKHQELESCAVR